LSLIVIPPWLLKELSANVPGISDVVIPQGRQDFCCWNPLLFFAKVMTKTMSRRVGQVFGVRGTLCYLKLQSVLII